MVNFDLARPSYFVCFAKPQDGSDYKIRVLGTYDFGSQFMRARAELPMARDTLEVN